MLNAPFYKPSLFFWIASRIAARAVAMTPLGGLLRAVAMTRLGGIIASGRNDAVERIDDCERVISKALIFIPSLRAVEDGVAIHALCPIMQDGLFPRHCEPSKTARQSMLCDPLCETRCFFWIASRIAARAVAMTRLGS